MHGQNHIKSVNNVVQSRETDSDDASDVLLNRNNLKHQQLTTIIINLINIFTYVINQINFSKVNHILVNWHLLMDRYPVHTTYVSSTRAVTTHTLFTVERFGPQPLGHGGQVKRKEIMCEPRYK